MTRRIVLLNLALLALAAALVWTLRAKRIDAKKHEAAVLRQSVARKSVMEPLPAQPAPPVAPANYLPVAENMLFSKDRNPTVVIEPPPAKPEPPMPPLPRYHGQMSIGEPIALLSAEKLGQKGYHAGDEIGDFKIVSFDRERIAFEWQGKAVERKLEELAPKAPVAAPGQVAARPAQAAPPSRVTSAPATDFARSSAPAVTSLAGDAGASKNPAGLGEEISDGLRRCLPDDDSPADTTREGYKKRVIRTPMGPVCRWELVK